MSAMCYSLCDEMWNISVHIDYPGCMMRESIFPSFLATANTHFYAVGQASSVTCLLYDSDAASSRLNGSQSGSILLIHFEVHILTGTQETWHRTFPGTSCLGW